MNIGKKIFVGCIILLLSMTPILAATELNHATDISPIKTANMNSLGTVTIVHLPLLPGWLRQRGMTVKYEAPEDNPTFEYYFPEDENGYVHMNFTLNVKHRKNPVGFYLASWIWSGKYRYTGIHAWVAYNGEDIIDLREYDELCIQTQFENFTRVISGDLKTDGENLSCLFWWNAWPGITPLDKIKGDLCEYLLVHHIVDKQIIIHPT